MHLTGVQRDGSRLFIRFLSHLAFHTRLLYTNDDSYVIFFFFFFFSIKILL